MSRSSASLLATLGALWLGAGSAAAAPAAGPAPLLQLAWPIACTPGRDCWVQNYFDEDPGPQARDYRCGHMSYDGHDGVDIRLGSLASMRRGVAVLAAGPGVVKATRDGVPDISIRDPANPHLKGQDCGNAVVVTNEGGWQTVYCHMRQGSVRVKSGERVQAGQQIGLVGLSGETEFPHLHIGVRQGQTKVDPFSPDAPGRCGAAGRSLWSPAVAGSLAYRSPALINSGFSAGPAAESQIEAEQIRRPARSEPLVAYARAIGLEGGDVQSLVLSGPDGELARSDATPLDRSKAVYLTYVGRKAPAKGWKTGVYRARYAVTRGGKVVLERSWTLSF